MKSLVLGGTGFIGRRLVNHLLFSGHEVSLVTSGKSPNPFGETISKIVCDRFQRDSLVSTISKLGYHDIVFDTIGYRSVDVKNALDAIGDRAGKYVYISSAAVYSGKEGIMGEEMFDSNSMKASAGLENSYSEGKKISEAYLLKNASMPVSIARFPIVMGHDDSTLRFQNHVKRILAGEEFHFREPEGKRNYVWVEDAGRFLHWLSGNKNSGIFNAASPDSVKASALVSQMAEHLGAKARIKVGVEESDSGYAAESDLIVDVSKAEKAGFKFAPTSQWLEEEVKKAKHKGLTSPNSMEYAFGLFGNERN